MSSVLRSMATPLVWALCAVAGALTGSAALAADAVDIGVIKETDVRVVQKLLYPKEGRTEFGFHAGLMPFDAYLTTPNGQLSFDYHFSEAVGLTVLAGGGYGLPTATLNELQSPTYSVSPDAYRYLGSVLAGVGWSPIYAKMNLNGAKVLHYDVYGAARAGVSFEQSILQDGGFAVAPTVSLGVGSRVFLGERLALRAELHDDVLLEQRKLTQSMFVKQNVNFLVGLTFLSKAEGR
jgi:outer membrane beta-barrel protein